MDYGKSMMKLLITCAKLEGSIEGLIAFIEDNINNEDFKPELLKRVDMVKILLDKIECIGK